MVQYPLLNRPTIVRPGDPFNILCKANEGASGWTATLMLPQYDINIPLQVNVGNYSSGIRKLTATVPSNAPFELYNLIVRAAGGSIQDEVEHCVHVIPEYKNSFTMIHLPDCHLPSVAWIGFYDDPNTVPEFLQVQKEINLIHPEFVLQTGDLVDNGQNESQYQIVMDLLDDFEIPIFVTGGNHDLWYDAHAYWYRYFGTTMDYSFLYNNIRFIGLEMYDIPSKTYTANQMNWLRKELNASINARESSRILFTHYDESHQLTGDFVDQYLIDGILYGHTHINGEEQLGLRQALNLNTSYTMNDNGEYRILKFKNGKIVDYPVVQFRHLWVNIAPVNDGSSWKMQADIHNQLVDRSNGAGIDLEDVMVKLHVARSAAPFTVSGGDVLQFIDYGNDKRVYYITADVPANSSRSIRVEGTSANEPPMITTYSPLYDTTLYGGAQLLLSVQVRDTDTPNLTYTWRKDGQIISGQTGRTFTYAAPINFQGKVDISVEVNDGALNDIQSWIVYINKSTGKPVLKSQARAFFPYDQEAIFEWIEPIPSQSELRFGLRPGRYTGSIQEVPGQNKVRFIPQKQGMGLGIYYCKIFTDLGLNSDEFQIVIEANQAPNMTSPIGDVTSLTPIFQWEPVQGVPYYSLIVTDQKIVIIEDPKTGDFSVEGANPIWGILTPETSVPYGTPDPSNTFTSFPAPLMPGSDYWWLVLNCYGNAPELTSTIQSGVGHFHIDLPKPEIDPPLLISPDDDANLSGAVIQFRWSAVSDVVGYHFYPFKVELEEGIEVVRPIWQSIHTTTNTLFEYHASQLLVKGRYLWKVAAVTKNGAEVTSQSRRFSYDAPFATLNIRTYDNKGTSTADDDVSLPRVKIEYDAISGVDMGLPLSTNKHGSRNDIIFAPGTYSFLAQKDGFAPYADTLTLAQNQVDTVNFRMSPDPSTLNGTVYDQYGNSVPAAQVVLQHSLHPTITRQTNTVQNGDFSISLIPGPWLIQVSKSGYQSSNKIPVTIPSGEIKDLESPITLVRNENVVSGTIVNTSSIGVYGAEVTIKKGDVVETKTTDATGRFSFIVSDGTWILSAYKRGFTSPAARQITVSGGQSLEVSPNLVLDPNGAMVSGTVTDGVSAVANAEVKAIPISGPAIVTQSDNYGQYTLTLTPGYYSLKAQKTGYSSGDPEDVLVDPGKTVSGVSLLLEPNDGQISGLVTIDGFTPLAEATVRVNGDQTETGDGGFYTIQIPSGTYQVSASKTRYLSDTPQQVNVSLGQKIDGINFVLSPNASVITGRIYDRNTGTGIIGADIFATNGTLAESKSDDNGYYTLNVFAGNYKVYAYKAGFISDTLQFEVGQAQTLEGRNVRMTRNIATIAGVVKDVSNHELMGVTVSIPDLKSSTTTTVYGEYQIQVEPVSTGYQINVYKDGYESKVQSTGALFAGAAVTLDFSLRVFTTRLSGQILDEKNRSVGSANVTAISGSESYSVLSLDNGQYVLGLPSGGGTFQIAVEKPGYILQEGSVSVAFSPGQQISRDFELKSNFAGLSGKVYNDKLGVENSFIPQATLQLQQDTETIASSSTDDLGLYHFLNGRDELFLVEDSYDLCVLKTGYNDTLIKNVVLTGNHTTTLNIGIRKYDAAISGFVNDGSQPVDFATIVAEHARSGKRFSQISDAHGEFNISSIPSGDYSIQVSREGYTWSVNVNTTAPVSNLVLTLSENTGKFWGIIKDEETEDPISNATIRVRDGHGNENKTASKSDGSYNLDRLPTLWPYTVIVSRSGYHTVQQSNVVATLDTSLNFTLKKIYGSIQGQVRYLNSGDPASNVTVRIQGNANQERVFTTNAQGQYSATKLQTDLYYVIAEQLGYLSAPASRTVPLYSGGDSTNVDFQLEKVFLKQLTILGPTILQSGGSGSFSYSATTLDGRQIDIVPSWTVDIPLAIDSLTNEGMLYPKMDFIGPLLIMLVDSYYGMKDTLEIKVVSNIEPGNPVLNFQNYQGAQVRLSDDCVIQPITFGLRYPRIPESKRVLASYTVEEPVYGFSPAYLTLNKSMQLTLPIPEGAPSNSQLGMWDQKKLKWLVQQARNTGIGLQIETPELAQWGILSPSEVLGIRDFKIEPNPFSPFIGPLDIAFRPTTRVSTHVLVSIRIYNMVGDLVRELWPETSVVKGETVHVPWDGKTDSGSLALNGRYLIHMIVRDGEGTKKKLVPVVLIK